MNTTTIKFNGQTLTLSGEDVLALETALIQARNAPNQEIQQMTNNGIMLVYFQGLGGQHFSRSLTPMDGTLTPTPKTNFSTQKMPQTDC